MIAVIIREEKEIFILRVNCELINYRDQDRVQQRAVPTELFPCVLKVFPTQFAWLSDKTKVDTKRSNIERRMFEEAKLYVVQQKLKCLKSISMLSIQICSTT